MRARGVRVWRGGLVCAQGRGTGWGLTPLTTHPVQVHAIAIKEDGKLRKEQVNVGGHEPGQQNERGSAHQLVSRLVADH